MRLSVRKMFDDPSMDIGFDLDVLITQFRWLEEGKMDEKLVKSAIKAARKRINVNLKTYPELKRELPDLLMESYSIIKESLTDKSSPKECKWTLDNLLDKDYYPLRRTLTLVK